MLSGSNECVYEVLVCGASEGGWCRPDTYEVGVSDSVLPGVVDLCHEVGVLWVVGNGVYEFLISGVIHACFVHEK